MASATSLLYPSLTPAPSLLSSTRPSNHRRRAFISASVSEKSIAVSVPPSELPIRKIPGDYGLPFFGPIRDRLAYFYTEGSNDFFRSQIERYGSTVFRTNMPPGPFLAQDSRVIALLDAASFPVLFDTSLVEKRDLFTGTYMPSTDLTGGYRVLSYLDPSEPNHAPLKKLIFTLLESCRYRVIPEFRRTFGSLFESMEAEISKDGKSDFGVANDRASFDFLARCFFGKDPADSPLGADGPGLITKWVLFQIGPLLKLGLPAFIEEIVLHSFLLPPALIRSDYSRLADFFRDAASPSLDEAERLGISREEALHNIIFAICFNTFGGMKILFPNIVKWVGRGGGLLHGRLAEEIRSAVRTVGDGKSTMRALGAMPLTKSVVYEALRIEPPVSLQYGRAKRDLVVTSHDAAYEVRAGEMLFGYQPFATRDPRVFDRAEEFLPERFLGPDGEGLLQYVVWSNGTGTESPTTENKQCAGKDFVELVGRMLLVELFMRYDSFDVEVSTSALGSSVALTSLKRATF